MNNTKGQPYYTARGIGNWPRHVTEGSFRIWDMAKPGIAQVHGYCLAGASELATACDLVYVAQDAQMVTASAPDQSPGHAVPSLVAGHAGCIDHSPNCTHDPEAQSECR